MADFTRIGTTAIAQNTSAYFYTPNMATVAIDTIAVSSGTYKIYGASDYGPSMADPTTAHWVPIASIDTAGVEVAANSAVTPSTTKTVYGGFVGFTGLKITEQNAGTVSVRVLGSTFVLTDVLAAVSTTITADTELPAAAALADNTATPTAPAVGAFGMVYDGSTWDMARGTAADGTLVNLGTNNDVTVTSGAISSYPVVREVPMTFSCDTGALAAGDVIADSQVVTNATGANDAPAYLVGIQVVDEDDQAIADMEMYLFSANVSLGTENNPISISDANNRNLLHIIKMDDTEWYDTINSKSWTSGASKNGGPWLVKPASGTRNIYAALVTRGTPTQTASGITARLFFQDCNAGA